jgi:hypothetical protein
MKSHPLIDFKKPIGAGTGSSGVTPTLKKAVWEMYVGAGIQEAPCTLCGIHRIKANVNSGFECAHIVARNYLTEALTVYYAFPSCSVCNNECHDMCVLDYMWARGRIAALRKVIMVIFQRFVAEHEHELAQDQRMAHLVLDNLYGPKRFPAGGGIQNTKQIYEIARTEQYQSLIERAAQLERQLGELQRQRQGLLEANIKPMRLE